MSAWVWVPNAADKKRLAKQERLAKANADCIAKGSDWNNPLIVGQRIPSNIKPKSRPLSRNNRGMRKSVIG
jgi:hypothetical protein